MIKQTGSDIDMHMSRITDKKRKIERLLLLLCTAVYLLWFWLLEQKVTTGYHIIHVGLDDYIPFCEYFIVPYLLWFAYVIVPWVYFYFRDQEIFSRMSRFLFGGMFICLFICTIYPNGTDLRPVMDPDKNVFCRLLGFIWQADTPTNILPSIHVYNSIGINIAIFKSARTRDSLPLKALSTVLCVLICLSTIFLKQHSCVDVLAASMLAYTMYSVVYEPLTAEDMKERMQRRRLAARQQTD